MKIGLITMGTGEYCQYLDNNLTTFYEYFFPSYERKFIYLTDNEAYIPPINAHHIHFPFFKWPLATLYKPKAIRLTEDIMNGCDIIYWIDVDLNCIDYVTNEDELFPTTENPICCVEHCGWLDETGKEIKLYPYELNPKSTACVTDIYKVPYHQACLFGGLNRDFYKMIKKLDANIDIDVKNEYIAAWHDESHLNKYFQSMRPKSIPKIYARPEAMGELLPNTKIKSIMKPNLNYE